MTTFAEFESAAAGTEHPLKTVLDALQFDEAGLLPAIAQDADSGQVLMLAWMNRQALEITLREGYACYFSRSRQSLWRKGETSGHVQKLQEARFDCDGDAILLLVEQSGPACHTNRPHCFYLQVADDRVRVTAEPR